VNARQTDPKFDCDPEGFFLPIQCQMMDDMTTTCHCVNPLTGITISSSEQRVINHRDKPVCTDGKQQTIFNRSLSIHNERMC